MNRHDRKAWKAARTRDDLSELVIRWLNGEVRETPCHMGPPAAETIPLIPALTAINRGGLITVGSQFAEVCDDPACDGYTAYVDGFTNWAVLMGLRAAVAGTPLILTACQGTTHECDRCEHWCRCPWSELTGFWADRCPALAGELEDCWLVSVEDPQPGRNDLLWPNLAYALSDDVRQCWCHAAYGQFRIAMHPDGLCRLCAGQPGSCEQIHILGGSAS